MLVPEGREVLSERLRKFGWMLSALIVATYTFLSYWEYSREFHTAPGELADMLAGRATAPGQYRVGVVYVAEWLSRLSLRHLAPRHMLAGLDGVFMAAGIGLVFLLLVRSARYLRMQYVERAAAVFLTFALLLFYFSWMFWFHKSETMANFGCLAFGAALVAGVLRMPAALAAPLLVADAAYLATVRADSGAALAVGICLIALLPGRRALPMGRALQMAAGAASLAVVLGIQWYLQHVAFPHRPYQSELFQFWNNLKSPVDWFCVLVSLAPWLLTMRLAVRHWARLEAWECALVVASVVEFLMFITVAMMDEVRLFLPYPLALLPVTVLLLSHELLGERDGMAGA